MRNKDRHINTRSIEAVPTGSIILGTSEEYFLVTLSESSLDAIFLLPSRASSIPYEMGDYQEQDVVGNQIVGAVKVGGWRYEDRSRYIGEWNQRGLRHGVGHLQLPDGTRYDGNFINGLCTGLGCLWFSDGSKYEGEFHQGWFHGYGIFWRSDGMKFEGEFRGGRIWGLGLVTFHDFTHGFPRNEGYFQDCRLIRRRRCPDIVQKAQKTALMARSQVDHPY